MARLKWLIVLQAAAAMSVATLTWVKLIHPGLAAASPRRADLHDKNLGGTNMAFVSLEGADLGRSRAGAPVARSFL